MAPTQNINSAADGHRRPTEISCEFEEASWRVGPLAVALASERHHLPRSVERRPPLTTHTLRWLADAVQCGHWTTDGTDRMPTHVLALSTEESPNVAYGEGGRLALLFQGALRYREGVCASPGLSCLVSDHVVVWIDQPFMHAPERNAWIARALRQVTVSAIGIEEWLSDSWGWLTELREVELGDLSDPDTETVDSFGYLVTHRCNSWGAACSV